MRLLAIVLLFLTPLSKLCSEELKIDAIGISIRFPDDQVWGTTEKIDITSDSIVWRKKQNQGDTLCVMLTKPTGKNWTATNALLDARDLPKQSEILSEEWTSISGFPSYRIVAHIGENKSKPYASFQFIVTGQWKLALINFSTVPEPEKSISYVDFCKTLSIPPNTNILVPRFPEPLVFDGKRVNGATKPINIDFQDDDLRSVIRNTADLFNENLVIPSDLPNARVSIKLRDVSFDGIMELVLKSSGFMHIKVRNVVWIVRAGDPQIEISRLRNEIQRRSEDEIRFKKSVELLLQMKTVQPDESLQQQIRDWVADPNSTTAKLIEILKASKGDQF